MVITGALISKKAGKAIAIGEWEALRQYLDQMKRLNPKTFSGRDFYIEQPPSRESTKQANICVYLSFGNTMQIKTVREEYADR